MLVIYYMALYKIHLHSFNTKVDKCTLILKQQTEE